MMAAKSCAWDAGARLMALFLLLAAAGTAMASSKEELQSIGEDEGVVVGSVLLTLAPGKPDESTFGFLGGRKAADLSYSVAASQAGVLELFARGFRVSPTPAKEEFFVEKLPAGRYRLTNLSPTGFVTQMSFPLDLGFAVKPQKVTYIGRLVIVLPDRLRPGARFSSDVYDAWSETLEKLKSDYPLIAGAVTELAGTLVPGNTSASPRLQRDTLMVVNALDRAADENCLQRAVVNTEAIKKPSRPDDTGEERWTVDRCGKPVSYRITFTPSQQGGMDIRVTPEK